MLRLTKLLQSTKSIKENKTNVNKELISDDYLDSLLANIDNKRSIYNENFKKESDKEECKVPIEDDNFKNLLSEIRSWDEKNTSEFFDEVEIPKIELPKETEVPKIELPKELEIPKIELPKEFEIEEKWLEKKNISEAINENNCDFINISTEGTIISYGKIDSESIENLKEKTIEYKVFTENLSQMNYELKKCLDMREKYKLSLFRKELKSKQDNRILEIKNNMLNIKEASKKVENDATIVVEIGKETERLTKELSEPFLSKVLASLIGWISMTKTGLLVIIGGFIMYIIWKNKELVISLFDKSANKNIKYIDNKIIENTVIMDKFIIKKDINFIENIKDLYLGLSTLIFYFLKIKGKK